jgi:hypothetical protein
MFSVRSTLSPTHWFWYTNETYINAQSVRDLLRKLAVLALKVSITLVLGNARY